MERWTVSFRGENQYNVWDQDGNYHRNTDIQAMRRRARIIQHAPTMLSALRAIAQDTSCPEAQRTAQAVLTAMRKRP